MWVWFQMIKSILKLAMCLSIWVIASVPGSAATKAVEQASQPSQQIALRRHRYQGDVYLLRGFGDVFSRGLDDMGAKLQSLGIDAKVGRHTDWRRATTAIIANQKKYGRVPVVLIGHSLGANAIIRIAEKLQRHKITVQYLATFEPTEQLEIPSNVKRAVNYYLSNSSMGLPLKKQRGSRGSFKNINLVSVPGVGHFNIDEQKNLQKKVISRVLRFVKPNRRKKSAHLMQ